MNPSLLHKWLREQALLATMTTFVRLLLAVGFIHAGLRKVTGEPFMNPGYDSPIGHFFDAFFQSGAFYAFVGMSQILAGILLMIPRTALLGAVIYFPIMLNILVITISMHFGGTWLVVLFMTAANAYLLFWDYPRLQPLINPSARRIPHVTPRPLPSRRVLVLIVCASSVFAASAFGVALLGVAGNLPGWTVVLSGCFGLSVLPLAAAAGWEMLRDLFTSRRPLGPAHRI